MDPTAAWGPACGLQLANWPVEEEPPAAEAYWAPPATGFPVEYASMVMFGTCSLPWPYVPAESSGGQQLVEHEHYYCSPVASQQLDGNSSGKQLVIDNPQNRETTKIIVSNDSHARDVFDQVAEEFEDDTSKLMHKKMHRYPAVLGALDKSYTVPRVVAMGPYHHHQPHLKKAEKVKHMAAIQCVRKSGHLLEEMYAAVVSIADKARRLYNKDVMAGIGYDDFWHMMFFDACFLVQYILMQTSWPAVDQSLCDFFGPNRKDINQDITLLENQLPWKDQRPAEEGSSAHRSTPDKHYKPPHLLGFLRHHSVGKISDDVNTTEDTDDTPISVSSALELDEIGINLKANISTDLIVMGLRQEGTLSAELSLAPLSLDHNRASYLANMATLELCTVRSFKNKNTLVEASAVCSYLQLLAMLVHREEDVQELRAKGILRGGGGLTNEQALCFFTSLQGQRHGKLYRQIMRDIEGYKKSRRMQTKLYSFLYNNRKTIAAGATGISVVGGIIGAIMSI
ncbi:hypothetical protein BS78_K297800 [Paspalum vaginatum]|uniref:Uncharacterized protein n=1 Tax=Paspalum vaginatum TaxID=158149 RepID=A0A9W7XAF1_9POAL|nr:hypothetical protein BS78_K297800 [Paspalum vaginatum]